MRKGEFSKAALLAALGCLAGLLSSAGPISSATASLFIQPFVSEFALSRTGVSGLLLIAPVIVGLLAPFVGQLVDRHGVRKVVIPMALVFGLTHIAALAVGSSSQVALFYILLGIGAAFHSSPAYSKVISEWFGATRGTVQGVVVAGGLGIGAALTPQLTRIWIDNYGWRGAYVGLSALVILIGVVPMYFLLRQPALTGSSLERAARRNALPGVSRAAAMKTLPFWLLAFPMFFCTLALVGTIAHSVPMLTERGLSSAIATTVLSLVYVGSMAGQIGSGILVDKVNSPRIVLPFFLAALIGVAILHGSADVWLLYGGALLFGLGKGSELGVAAYLATRYFGLRHFGSVYGALFVAANLGTAAGMLLMGFLYDMVGSYALSFKVIVGLMLLGVMPLFALPAYRFANRSVVEELGGRGGRFAGNSKSIGSR